MTWKSLPGCIVFLSAALLAQSNPVPLVNQPLQPTRASPGGAAFTLIVSGTGFVPGAVVRWNQKNRTSRFINSSQIAARILASHIAVPQTATVTVVNPSPSGGTSNPVFFQIASPRRTVTFSTTEVPSLKQLEAVVSGDFNHDGIPDVALTEVATFTMIPVSKIFLGNGNGTFRNAGSYYAGISPSAIVSSDFNHDGNPDLAVVSQAPADIFVLMSKGDARFFRQ